MKFSPQIYNEPPRDQVTNMGLFLMEQADKPVFSMLEILAGSKPQTPEIKGSLTAAPSWNVVNSTLQGQHFDLISDIHKGSHHHRAVGEAILSIHDYETMMHSWFNRLDQAAGFLNPGGYMAASVAIGLGTGDILERIQQRDDILLQRDGQVIVPITDATIKKIEDETKLRVVALEPGTTPQTLIAKAFYAGEGLSRLLLDRIPKSEAGIRAYINWQNEQVKMFGVEATGKPVRGVRYLADPWAQFHIDQILWPHIKRFGFSGPSNRAIIGFQRK